MALKRFACRSNELTEGLIIKFKVNDVVDAIAAVDQANVPADEDVTIAIWRRRQTTVIVRRNRVNPSAHISIEHVAFAEPRFVFRRQSIAIPEASRPTIMMLVVPVSCDLPIVVVKS